MAEVNPSKDAEKSRRSPETEQARKKQKKDPPTFSDPTSLLTFIVGKGVNSMKVMIHKEIACHHSKVLDTAFNSNIIKGQTQTYRLEETTEGTFELFMQWLYFQKLVSIKLDELSDCESPKVTSANKDLVSLWVLADKLGMPALQNVALNAIHDLSNKANCVFVPTFGFINANTTTDSLLRRYSVASCAEIKPEHFLTAVDIFPRQMLIDFAVYMIRKDRGLEKKDLIISDYFVNEN